MIGLKKEITKKRHTIYALALIACSWTTPHSHAVDGAPVEIETSTFTEGYKKVPAQRLFDLGVQATAQDALDGEYAFTFSFSEDLDTAINNGGAAVHFSVLTKDGDFALGIPKLDKKNMTFWMITGYKLRVMLEVKTGYRGLKKGVGYYAVLDPQDYLIEE